MDRNEEQRIVITGMGVISPIGNSLEEFSESLQAGRSGIGPITKIEPERLSKLEVTIAGEVKNFDPAEVMDTKEIRRTDPVVHYAIAAAEQALKQSGMDLKSEDLDRFGISVGTGIGCWQTIYDQHKLFFEKGKMHPLAIPMLMPNVIVAGIASHYGITGTTQTSTAACAAGVEAIIGAYNQIVNPCEEVDVCLAVGAEAAIKDNTLFGFLKLHALAKGYNDNPEEASRPFDRHRNGFVLAEGAGALTLESLEHAQRRGARIFAEVIGYGRTNDAYHLTEPSGIGAEKAMLKALRSAGISPADVDYINAHGTGTAYNDYHESVRIQKIFGDNIVVSAVKSMTGHTIGAAGLIESIATIDGMLRGYAPPTINFTGTERDDEFSCPPLNYVPNVPQDLNIRIALKNGFGFGGQNSTIVIKRWRE